MAISRYEELIEPWVWGWCWHVELLVSAANPIWVYSTVGAFQGFPKNWGPNQHNTLNSKLVLLFMRLLTHTSIKITLTRKSFTLSKPVRKAASDSETLRCLEMSLINSDILSFTIWLFNCLITSWRKVQCLISYKISVIGWGFLIKHLMSSSVLARFRSLTFVLHFDSGEIESV